MEKRSQERINADHYIDQFIIRAMSLGHKSVTFLNRKPKKIVVDDDSDDDIKTREYFLDDDLKQEMKSRYERLCFVWTESGDSITLSWN